MHESENVLEGVDRVRWALRGSGCGAWDWDLVSNEAWWSPEMYELWGVHHGTPMTFENSLAIVHEQDRDRLRSALETALQHNTEYQCEFRIHHLTRGERWMASHGRPMVDDTGRATRILGITLDITDRKRTEQSLRESEGRLRSVVDTAVEAIITIDHLGIIESFNRAAERMFGFAAAEVLGRNVNVLMPSPYHEEHDGYLDRYLRTGEARIIGIGRQVTAQRKDGTEFPIELSVSEISDLGLFTGIIRDISAQRETEERLRQADRLSAIGTLAAGLGHDMSNVLLPVRARLDYLDQMTLPVEAREQLIEIRKSARYLQDLADGLHLLALDPNERGAASDTTNLNEWWQQTQALLGRSLPRHVRFSASLPSNLPDITVAPHRLTQAVLNLLVNSAKAVGEDGRVRLWASVDTERQVVQLALTDNGSGMTDEVKRRALEPFFTTKTRGLGTGLGLSLVHGVVLGAGGTIDIDSAPDKGTTIVLKFPTVAAVHTPNELAQLDTSAQFATVSVADRRLHSLVTNLLEMAGVEVLNNAADVDGLLYVLDEQAARALGSDPNGKVILLGGVAAEWGDRNVRVVENPDDFDALREAITWAVEGHNQ